MAKTMCMNLGGDSVGFNLEKLSTSSSGTTITFAESIEKYKAILVITKTNVEWKTMLIPVAKLLTGVVFTDSVMLGSWNGSRFEYLSWLRFQFTSATTMTYTTGYSDINLQLRPAEFYGIE